METLATLETVGFISKEESLRTLNESIIPDTFVVENKEPFPGYHGKDLPGEAEVPEFIFFVTKKRYNAEKIVRIIGKIKKYFNHSFDATPAELNIFNDNFPCIRVKGLGKMEHIAELQSCFADEGIGFAKKQKVATKGIVKIHKVLNLGNLGDGVYKDIDKKDYFYFEIPTYLNWKLFYKITMNVKNNIENSNFDAATGGFFRKGGLTELVRIYDKNATPNRVMEIKEKYLEEITKFL